MFVKKRKKTTILLKNAILITKRLYMNRTCLHVSFSLMFLIKKL